MLFLRIKIDIFSATSKGMPQKLYFFNTLIGGLVLYALKLLNIDSTLHLQTVLNRGLVKLLTGTKLLNNTSLLKLTLELLQSALNVLTFFYRYYNHCF